MRYIFQEEKIDTVLHFAAQSHVGMLLIFSNVCYAPAPIAGALSNDARLTSVCLSRTSGLSREQRGLGKLKLAQR